MHADADEHVRPPGTPNPRGRPRLCFELLGCAWNGHVLAGADAASVAGGDGLVVRDAGRAVRSHRCLRCDAWILLSPPDAPTREEPPGRDEIVLPTRGRPLKSRIVLRLIALTRAFNVPVLLLVLGGVVAVLANRTALRESLLSSATALQETLGGQTVAGLQSLLSGGADPLVCSVLRGGAPTEAAELEHDVSWDALARHLPPGAAAASGVT